MKLASRESLDERVRQTGELYSSTIVKGITKVYPNLDPTIIEIIKELSRSGYIDGATMILDAIERVKSKEENDK